MGHDREITSIVFSDDGQVMGTSSADETARLWKPGSLEPSHILPTHGDLVMGITFNRAASRAFTFTRDRVFVWDVESGSAFYSYGIEDLFSRSSLTGMMYIADSIVEITSDGQVFQSYDSPIDHSAAPEQQKEQYQNYRNQWYASKESREPTSTSRVDTVFIARNAAVDNLATLTANLNDAPNLNANPNEPGVAVPESTSKAILFALQLEGVESIVRIGSIVIDSSDLLSQELERIRAGVASSALDEFQIEFIRAGELVRQRYLIVESGHTESNVSMPRDELVQRLTFLIDMTSKHETTLLDLQEFYQNRARITMEEGQEIHSFRFAGASFEVEPEEFRAVGFGSGDEITAVNGNPFVTMDGFIATIAEAIAAVERGESDTIQLRINRGAFQSVLLTLQAE